MRGNPAIFYSFVAIRRGVFGIEGKKLGEEIRRIRSRAGELELRRKIKETKSKFT